MSNKDNSHTHKYSELLRCNLCRRSYKKGKNHIYSSCHVENLRKALSRFGNKIIIAQSQLDCPVIKANNSSDEKHAKFWCYFCSKEIPKHVVFDNRVYLENAGLLEHISGAKHILMAKAFWRDNRLGKKNKLCQDKKTAKTLTSGGGIDDKKCSQSIMQDYYRDMRNSGHSDFSSSLSRSAWLKQHAKVAVISQVSLINKVEEDSVKQTTTTSTVSPELKLASFILSEADVQRFKNNSKQCVERYFAESDQKLSQDAKFIATCSKSRSLILDYFRRQMSRSAGNSGQSNWEKARTPSTLKTPGPGAVRTVSAYGEGLTCIGIPKVDESVGNIFTDAPPPWLQSPTDGSRLGSSEIIIGPTADDLKKHLERQKKLKLPATRVGANFNRRDAAGLADLPSFGGVWSKNCRSHQQAGFKKTLNFQGAQTFRNGVRSSACPETFRKVGKEDLLCGTPAVQSGLRMSIMVDAPPKISDNTIPKPGVYKRRRPVESKSNETSYIIGGRLNLASNLL